LIRRPVSVWTTLLEDREEEVAVDEGEEGEGDGRVMLEAQGGRSVTYPSTAVGARSKQHTAAAEVAARSRRRGRQAVVAGMLVLGGW